MNIFSKELISISKISSVKEFLIASSFLKSQLFLVWDSPSSVKWIGERIPHSYRRRIVVSLYCCIVFIVVSPKLRSNLDLIVQAVFFFFSLLAGFVPGGIAQKPNFWVLFRFVWTVEETFSAEFSFLPRSHRFRETRLPVFSKGHFGINFFGSQIFCRHFLFVLLLSSSGSLSTRNYLSAVVFRNRLLKSKHVGSPSSLRDGLAQSSNFYHRCRRSRRRRCCRSSLPEKVKKRNQTLDNSKRSVSVSCSENPKLITCERVRKKNWSQK